MKAIIKKYNSCLYLLVIITTFQACGPRTSSPGPQDSFLGQSMSALISEKGQPQKRYSPDMTKSALIYAYGDGKSYQLKNEKITAVFYPLKAQEEVLQYWLQVWSDYKITVKNLSHPQSKEGSMLKEYHCAQLKTSIIYDSSKDKVIELYQYVEH